ncbi:MAG: hypothetical protein Kilf2KO_35710 [Rhodospirillales bacterium]
MPHSKRSGLLAGLLPLLLLPASPARAEPLVWGVQAERLEYRVNEDENLFAWDFDAFVGGDELKFVWRSEAEYVIDDKAFETLENQARLQVPISDFFDAVAGVRVDTPDGPNRVFGVLGLHGLAPQWFEIDADLFIAQDPAFRLEAEYELLVTNRITLIPNLELDLPFTDDPERGISALGPKLEAGARLSYDLVDRLLSPYVGVNYERVFAGTADLARFEGEEVDGVFFVVGARVLF